MKKTVILAIAFALVLCLAVASTVAFFKTQKTITNVFVKGDGVVIELEEPVSSDAVKATTTPDTNLYPLIPGDTYEKDPQVIIGKTSESCYVFVKVEATGDEADALEYEINTTNFAQFYKGEAVAANKVANVYVMHFIKDSITEDTTYHVLKNNEVKISEELTQEELEAITTNPQIEVTLYAIQDAGFADAAAAWAEFFPASTATN